MRRFKVWLLTCLIPLIGFAQDNSDAVKAQIRELKKSEKYVYAESASSNGEVEARQYSTDALHAAVIGMFSEAGKDKNEAEKAWATVEKQAQQLVVKMGNMVKVFTYIPKVSLFPDAALPENNAVQAVAVDANTAKEVASTIEVADENIPSEGDFTADAALIEMILGSSSAGLVESKPQSGKEIVAAREAADVAVDSVVVVAQPLVKAQPAVVDSIIEVVPVVEVQPEPRQSVVVENPLKSLPESSRAMLTTLLSKQTFKEAISYLYEMKEKGRMIYGRIKTMTSPENSYLVIVKNGQLITVLNKGKATRVNLKTNTLEPVTNYMGYGIIWFQIF